MLDNYTSSFVFLIFDFKIHKLKATGEKNGTYYVCNDAESISDLAKNVFSKCVC